MRIRADREKELIDARHTQESNIQGMLQKMAVLDKSALDRSGLDRSHMDTSQIGMDRSALFDQMQGIQAIIDPDN